MPFTNFSSRHFSDVEKTAIELAMTEIETMLADKVTNLSNHERQQYGCVNEHNKLFINSVKEFRETQEALSSPDIDWAEFHDDYATRNFIESTMHRLKSVLIGLKNTKTLHDWDNYQAALTDYNYSKYKNKTGVIGYANKVSKLGQYFTGGPKSRKNKNEVTQ